MTQENDWTSGKMGPFHLGAHHDALGPGLGQLYEAWCTHTGAPVLLLRPGDDVEWRPEGSWRVLLAFEPAWSAVALIIQQAPLLADVSELANLLTLSTAAVTRVEDNPRVRAHLSGRLGEGSAPSPSQTRWRWSSYREAALAGLLLISMGATWWSLTRGCASPCPIPTLQATVAPSEPGAVLLGNAASPDAGGIAYPMPARPLDDQAVVPCDLRLDEVELNGACWYEMVRRPPCLEETQAEYKGKCYVPISKERLRRRRQSAQP